MAGGGGMNRGARGWRWLALAALPGGCGPAAEKAPPPTRPQMTVIRHNDGTAQRLAVGAPVRIPGILHLDFEHGAMVANFMPPVPPPGVPVPARDPDFVCADLDIDMPLWGELMPLSGRAATVTGTVAPPPGPGACPIYLDHVRVAPR